MYLGTSTLEPFVPASIVSRSRPVPRDGAPKRILIVEDEVLLADDMAQSIHAMGLDPVGPVGALEAAIALAETQRLDGALLDVRLRRGMRVYPVVEILLRRRIPFCFLTAYIDEQIEHMPAEAVLRKPVALPVLRQAVQALLDG
ncbi:response regulator [Inquilinus sp. OTU3971]|uniref:response regulator n=1 Tax=Inquilinus sp. OTU3971 TaxID=3043855 RepID=UPI00313CCAD2